MFYALIRLIDRLVTERCFVLCGTNLIARHFSPNDFLNNCGVPLFNGLDTRALTKYLVSHPGAHKSVLTTQSENPGAAAFDDAKLFCNELELVSQSKEEVIVPGDGFIKQKESQ